MIFTGGLSHMQRIRVRTLRLPGDRYYAEYVIELDDFNIYLTADQLETLLGEIGAAIGLHQESDPAAV